MARAAGFGLAGLAHISGDDRAATRAMTDAGADGSVKVFDFAEPADGFGCGGG